jgi:high-affinity nickel permease
MEPGISVRRIPSYHSHGADSRSMITFLSIVAVGFFLGMRHATDPDHVVAVTTIVSRQRNVLKAAFTGIFWGIGHTITIFIVGAAIILFGVVIPARVGLSMELSVGVMLILLGAANIISFLRSTRSISSSADGAEIVHSHVHRHGDNVHVHGHVHAVENHLYLEDHHTALTWMDRMFGKIGLYQQLRPLLIGIVHGLAGSAAIALLILTTIRNPRWALVYLLVFGVGTVGGMMLITMSIASAVNFFGTRHESFSRWLGLASGLVSLVFGFFLAYQMGYASGLFSSHPQWAPH